MITTFQNTALQTEKAFEFFNSTEFTPNQGKAEKESVLIEDYFLQILLSEEIAQSKSFDSESLLNSLCTLKFKSVKSFLSKLISSKADKYTKGYTISFILRKYNHEEFKKLLNEVSIDLLTKNIFNDITNYAVLKGCWQILLLWLLNQKQSNLTNGFLYIFLSKIKKVKETTTSYFSFLHGINTLLRAKCVELDFQLLKEFDIGEIILTLAKFHKDSGIPLPISRAFETHLEMLLSNCCEVFGEKIGSLSPQLQQAWINEKAKRVTIKQQEEEIEEKKKEVVSIQKILEENPSISVEDACIALADSQEEVEIERESAADMNAELIDQDSDEVNSSTSELAIQTLRRLIQSNYDNLLHTDEVNKHPQDIWEDVLYLQNQSSEDANARVQCLYTLLDIVDCKALGLKTRQDWITKVAYNPSCSISLQQYIAEEISNEKEANELLDIIKQKKEELERSDTQKSVFAFPSGEKTTVVRQKKKNNIRRLTKIRKFLNTDISKFMA